MVAPLASGTATATATATGTAPAVPALAAAFAVDPGYLGAAASGLAPTATARALAADLERWSRGDVDPARYDAAVHRARAAYARVVGVDVARVALGSQTSTLVGVAATALPAGAEVLVASEDFTSVTYPFLARGDLVVRDVPLARLAEAVAPGTAMVAFSLVQSATGEVADADAITAAARRHGTITLADLTQAAGVLPVDATAFDLTVCHAYKWLCCPRGVAFLTVSTEVADRLVPTGAGWYAGADPWASVYGVEPHLADDARRFDVSPAWQACVGAAESLELFAAADQAELWAHASGLGDALCRALGLPEQHQAIVTWPDTDGRGLAALRAAGITASGRAGRLRAAFHVWNTLADVEAVVAALA